MKPTRLAPVLMVQGTASHAGKSTVTAGLCRLFARAGYRVAPFKAQNMSNNAAVTADGGEVGRAQAMQATAAGIPVTVDMNPVLLKPQSDRTSQMIVLGKVAGRNDAREYYRRTDELWPIVSGALDRLRSSFDIVIAEGAGSPAEINLARYDLVNMRVARHANAAVLLVGDIDRGGVFAALYGTWALLPPDDRARIGGYVINKFRGDPSLLDPGFAMLEELTGIPTLGVLPYVDLGRLPAEDALDWAGPHDRTNEKSRIDVAIIRLPRVANLDEFQPLMTERAVCVRWVADAAELGEPDLVIVPGTKSTMADLAWMRERGLDAAVRCLRDRGRPVLGICGGFQMLGTTLIDDEGIEGQGTVAGLGLLPIVTTFESEKLTRRVVARVTGDCALWRAANIDEVLDAYEIHMGRTAVIYGASTASAPFALRSGVDVAFDGCSSTDGLVVGTYMHGLLENDALRHELVRSLAGRRGIELPQEEPPVSVDQEIDRLADMLRDHMNLAAVGELVRLSLVTG